MKTQTKMLAALLGFGATMSAFAGDFDDYARVLSAAPQYEQVNHPRRECRTEYEEVHEHRSPGGAIIGGVAGGVIGSQVGRGNGRLAGTAIGAITGAIVGDRIDNDRPRYYERPVRACHVVDEWETRVTGYTVTYEYQGRTYTTVMPYDPGDRIKVRVAVSPRG
jgi:uncharacterized protein YcfJ